MRILGGRGGGVAKDGAIGASSARSTGVYYHKRPRFHFSALPISTLTSCCVGVVMVGIVYEEFL